MFLLLVLVQLACCCVVVWPQPQEMIVDCSVVKPFCQNFSFVGVAGIDVLQTAFKRYEALIFQNSSRSKYPQNNGCISAVHVTVANENVTSLNGADETYTVGFCFVLARVSLFSFIFFVFVTAFVVFLVGCSFARIS
jgi:hypothetical protein